MRIKGKHIPAGQTLFAADGELITGTEELMLCVRCSRYLPLDMFHKSKTCYCKECHNEYMRQHYKAMSERQRRGISLRKNYGISHDEYDRLWEAQGGVCAACGMPETKIDSRTQQLQYLSVDHDHATGEVRALLCNGCNTALGSLGEDPARIRALLAYAKRIHKLKE